MVATVNKILREIKIETGNDNISFQDIQVLMYRMQINYNNIINNIGIENINKEIIKEYLKTTIIILSEEHQNIITSSCDKTKNLRYLNTIKNSIKLICEFNRTYTDKEIEYIKDLDKNNINSKKLNEAEEYIVNFYNNLV